MAAVQIPAAPVAEAPAAVVADAEVIKTHSPHLPDCIAISTPSNANKSLSIHRQSYWRNFARASVAKEALSPAIL